MRSTVWVYTMSRAGEVGAWSRYKFPFQVDAFCQKGDHLYIRAGDDVLMVDEKASTDFQGDARERPFDGVVQWPWLDFGQPGVSKQMIGLDVSTMTSDGLQIEIGYDQSDKTAFTTPHTITGETVPGTIIPMPVLAPSFSVRLTLSSYHFWQLQAVTLYVNDQRMTA